MSNLETVYRLPNGDDWLVEHDPEGRVATVIHQANQASGGILTRMPVDEFLERSGSGPEVMAVLAAVAAAEK